MTTQHADKPLATTTLKQGRNVLRFTMAPEDGVLWMYLDGVWYMVVDVYDDALGCSGGLELPVAGELVDDLRQFVVNHQ